MGTWQVGVDVGGTNTDLLFLDHDSHPAGADEQLRHDQGGGDRANAVAGPRDGAAPHPGELHRSGMDHDRYDGKPV